RARRSHLQRYAAHARRSLLTGLERAELAHRVRLAGTARRIVRQVSSELSIDDVVRICQPAVTTGFDAVGMWIQTFDQDRGGTDAVYGATQGEIVVADEFKLLGRDAAVRLWRDQEVALGTQESFPKITGLAVEPNQRERLWAFMEDVLEATSLLFVPIGDGKECLGNMALTRRGAKDEWSLAEQEAALEIGHDLGRALRNARAFERERRLLAEVRELASYKSRLIAMIAHELRIPLTGVLGHLELMETTSLPASVATSVRAVGRGAHRMRQMIEDLLVLSQVGDPSRVLTLESVDLGQVVEEVLGLLDATLTSEQFTVEFEAPAGRVQVAGDAGCLDRMCTNLIGNAAKYTPGGGTIIIAITPTADAVELSISDTGVGISAEDQEHLFEEFFRSTDADVLATPGTGLGLAIVHRIVEQHHGTISVDSVPGQGSTFTVTLPAASGQD
ncbi:MAG: HAMP domain-containing histidine kinase, partial [Nocardioides sp.]|nr:HAMP domain-containing histidine kinase [Nocardioides sp.]